MPPELPTAFLDLPPEAYPFTIDCLNEADEVVHSITVTEPGAIVVPGLAAKHGPIHVVITYVDHRWSTP